MGGLLKTSRPTAAGPNGRPNGPQGAGEAPVGGWRYLIALGSNMRHHRHGLPPAVIAAALVRLDGAHGGGLNGGMLAIEKVSAIIASAPLGPSRRRYANGVALVRSPLSPPALLALLKAVERGFGRRRGGRRWGARVLDLDIVLWQGGCWRSTGGPPGGAGE